MYVPYGKQAGFQTGGSSESLLPSSGAELTEQAVIQQRRTGAVASGILGGSVQLRPSGDGDAAHDGAAVASGIVGWGGSGHAATARVVQQRAVIQHKGSSAAGDAYEHAHEADGGAVPVPGDMSGTSSTGMPRIVQHKMETAFDADFCDVSIHAGSRDATAMGALAYTQGSDIHFAPGQYNPHSHAGQELLGHELAHVVQQREGRVAATSTIQGKGLNDSPTLEHEADVQGALAAQGAPATAAASHTAAGGGGALQRKPVQAKAARGAVQRRTGGVIQRVGGPIMGPVAGQLCVVSNVANAGLTAGHAWLSYTPVGGRETTFGTFPPGSGGAFGMNRNRELYGYNPNARRCADIDEEEEAALHAFIDNNSAWSFINNCASMAGRGWQKVTGENLPYASNGIPNPSALGAAIKAAGPEYKRKQRGPKKTARAARAARKRADQASASAHDMVEGSAIASSAGFNALGQTPEGSSFSVGMVLGPLLLARRLFGRQPVAAQQGQREHQE